MRQHLFMGRSTVQLRSRSGVTSAQQEGMARGLLYAVVLSLAVWSAAGGLVLILR
ncbi:MAG TPA: hypothetical protein VGC09_02760 [Rhodopila sp.]